LPFSTGKIAVEVKVMATALLKIMQQAEKLTADEQLELAAKLIEQARKGAATARPRRRWLELAGAATYPMLGEDAQAWVSRTRQEGDDERESQWRRRE
jgi:type II secretory pathway pseudopilin PulG